MLEVPLLILQDVGIDEGQTFASVIVQGVGQKEGLQGLNFDTTGIVAPLASLGRIAPPFGVEQDADYDIRDMFSSNEKTDVGTTTKFSFAGAELTVPINAPLRKLSNAPAADRARVVMMMPAEALIAKPAGGALGGLLGDALAGPLGSLGLGGLHRALGPLTGVSGSRITDAAGLLQQIRDATTGVDIVDVLLVGGSGSGGPFTMTATRA